MQAISALSGFVKIQFQFEEILFALAGRRLTGNVRRKMRLLLIVLAALAALPACAKKEPPQKAVVRNEETAFSVNPEFPGGTSVLSVARKIFPECGQIALLDFWTSADDTHEFVVFFAGREIKGSFESMYWRYVAFVKKKSARDWLSARVFDLPDNRFGPIDHSLAWLEQNAKELKAPIPESSAAPERAAGPRLNKPGSSED